jgi:phage shock protein A
MAETGLAIERARERTEQMQARAGALDELIEAGTLADVTALGETELDRELAHLEAGDQIEQELAALRGELPGTAAGSLSEGGRR